MADNFTYPKTEKLKSRKLIEEIFAKGKSFNMFPLKVFYMMVSGAVQPLQAGVGVSSRNFKKAVDRNRIKRLLREAYRLNKSELQATLALHNNQAILFFLYVGKEMPDFDIANDKMKLVLKKVAAVC